MPDWTSRWSARNPFAPQPAGLRIEALMSVEPYESNKAMALAQSADEWGQVRTADSRMKASLLPSAELDPAGTATFQYSAHSKLAKRRGAWTAVEKVFRPPIDLSGRQGMGVWVHGDGRGQILNIQLKSPEHFIPATGDHYIDIDFVGWRYFEIVEPEGERYGEHLWPYGSPYTIYRESVDYRAIESLSLWYNNLPPGRTVNCLIGQLRALPLAKAEVVDPAITVGRRTLTFPTRIESGSCLEFNSPADCHLYGPKGELLKEVEPRGSPPMLRQGSNRLRFSCVASPKASSRANVTVISEGPPLRQ